MDPAHNGRTFASLLLLSIGIAKCHGDWNPLELSSDGCVLTEPIYNHTFNFTALRSDFVHSAVGHGNDRIEYNICGNLLRKCDGRDNVGACLKRDGKEYVLGVLDKLVYKDGQMYFTFLNGTNCRSGEQYELLVFVKCDYLLDRVQSRVLSYANDVCKIVITLDTPVACLPEPDNVKGNLCTVKDEHTDFTFHLMSLSEKNYWVMDPNGVAFVINVCKPVLYDYSAMCPADSSVCRLDTNATDYSKRFLNYGTVQANPVQENGQLLMRLPSPTKCNSTHNYSSIIMFDCDKDGKDARPKFVGLHMCTYSFRFYTLAACSDLAPCTALVHSNEIVDMSPLKGVPFHMTMDNRTYTFAVCSAANSPCGERDGSCVIDGDSGAVTSLGKTNAHLRFNRTGTPYLLYEDGSQCSSATTPPANSTASWSTRVEFVCPNNVLNATKKSTATEPKIIENSNCELLIQHPTELACHDQMKCSATWYAHGNEAYEELLVDVTPLINNAANYEARISDALAPSQVNKSTKFFLNVCRPLVMKFGLGCPAGSAACMATQGPLHPEHEVSLGYPTVSLVAVGAHAAELLYLEGGPCPTQPSMQIASGIRFECDIHAGRGTPILKSIMDCYYQFEWATNVICPPHQCTFHADKCEIMNMDTGEHYGLHWLRQQRIEALNNSSIDICGQKATVRTDYAHSLVLVTFYAKGLCAIDDDVVVELHLVCTDGAPKHETVYKKEECNLVYTVQTPDICKFLGIPVSPVTTSRTTTTTTTSADGRSHPKVGESRIGWILGTLLMLIMLASCVAFVGFSPSRRNRLRRCFRTRLATVRYSRVWSTEEANVLLETVEPITNSDDDMLL